MTRMTVGCVQMCSAPDVFSNLKTAEALIRRAHEKGACFIATPENTDLIRTPLSKKLEAAVYEKDHPAFDFFSNLARELSISLLIGSVSVRLSDEEIANRALYYAPDGSLITTYDKIHLFDSVLSDEEAYKESAVARSGREAVLVHDKAGFNVGLSICYDLRFPRLFRRLAQAGAQILAVPAAFAYTTGKVHWETLLKARAIETGSFVIAPGQCGMHEGGRKTWGHSMIISPWGEVIASAQNEPEIVMADIDLEAVTRVRQTIPAISTNHEYTLRTVKADDND